MKILLVGGYLMTVGDGHPYWTLAARLTAAGHEVRARECDEDWWFAPARTKVTAEDVAWADAAVIYSYGGASLQRLLLGGLIKPLKLLIGVAIVPDWLYAQNYNGWNFRPFTDRAICLQVDGTFPVSMPLDAPWLTDNEAPAPGVDYNQLPPGDLNINVNAWVDQPRHVQIAATPHVLDGIVAIFGDTGMTPAAGAGGTDAQADQPPPSPPGATPVGLPRIG